MLIKSLRFISINSKLTFCQKYFSLSCKNYVPMINPYEMDATEALVFNNDDQENISLAFKYVDNVHNIVKMNFMNRKKSESNGILLQRIEINVSKAYKKRKNSNLKDIIDSPPIIAQFIKKNCNTPLEDKNLSIYDILVNCYDKYLLKVNDNCYFFKLNPPAIEKLSISHKIIMVGSILIPSVFELSNCKLEDVKFTWHRSINSFTSTKLEEINQSHIQWEEISSNNDRSSLLKHVNTEDIGKLLKISAIPFDGKNKGVPCEAISNVIVTPPPNKFPFENSHQHTSKVTDNSSLRFVSYNILADLYARTDFSQQNLFPTCPPYALAIDYRLQLIVKELLGYNADVINLQEVDTKVFERQLQPIFSHFNLNSVFQAKKINTGSEGLAMFYRNNKLELLDTFNFIIKDEIMNNPLFSDILSKIKLNEKAYETVINRPNILLICVFASKTDPSKRIIVGSTHLYFHPLADHIRILQASVCLTLLQHVVELTKIKTPECETSLVFSGDFNSSPGNAVYRFMKSQFIAEDDPDWSSKPEEELTGITLSHSLELDSACGTPPYTNYVTQFKDCIDYIFYESDKFSVTQSVPLPTHEEVMEHEALPSITIPSDHLALVADLRWKK